METFTRNSMLFECQMTTFSDDRSRDNFNKLDYYYDQIYTAHSEMLKEGDFLLKSKDKKLRKYGEEELDKVDVKFIDIQYRFTYENERRTGILQGGSREENGEDL